MNVKSKVVIITLLMLFSYSIIAMDTAHGAALQKNAGGANLLASSGVIRINNNTDFATQAAANNWPGNGSASNPYIISGYDIDAYEADEGIYIGNTTVNFVIENCKIYNATQKYDYYIGGSGIALSHVTNGVITNNIIINSETQGIMINSSSNNSVINNYIEAVDSLASNGVFVQSSSYDFITGNTIVNCSYGISPQIFSDHQFVTNNTVTGSLYGIVFVSVSYGAIDNNTVENSSKYGIYFLSSSYNTISGNTIIRSTEYGMNLSSNSDNNEIYNNTFYYNNGSNGTFDASHVQAYDNSTGNIWNSTKGNYWYDWANNNNTNDQDSNGIVDWPYKIAGSANSEDYLPLAKTVPTPPQNIKVSSGAGYVNISWELPTGNGSANITGFRIYRNDALITTVSASQLWYNDTNVVNGQTYTYYVVATNSIGNSNPSNRVQVTPGGAVPEFGSWSVLVILALGMVLLVRRKNSL